MSSVVTVNLLRFLFVAFTTFLGSEFGHSYWNSSILGMAAGIAFGLTVILADRMAKSVSLRAFSSATFGLFLGFLASRLLLASGILWQTPPRQQWLISLAVYATFAYIGMILAMRSNRDEFALIIPYVRFRRETAQESPLLIDSNIIIDGRLPDIAATGFISNSFVIPQFILEELQTLADSHEPAKREKGRSALSHIQDLQRNPAFNVNITGTTLDHFAAVDTKLIQLAKMTGSRILTNDSNLCSIARMQGVTALNLNDLTRAMRPALTAGDELEVPLTKEGRDNHQAVGYLKDGTMIVVNHARPHLGKTVKITISSVLQTQAGRMFFAELKQAA